MTYAASDTSVHGAEPQELFEFVGSGDLPLTSHYGISSRLVGLLGNHGLTYTAIPMMRSTIRITANGRRSRRNGSAYAANRCSPTTPR
jgi:hypothetical protein